MRFPSTIGENQTQSPPLHHHCRAERGGEDDVAREFPPREAGILHFVNADLIAAGFSPLKPELAALAAGRLLKASGLLLGRRLPSLSP